MRRTAIALLAALVAAAGLGACGNDPDNPDLTTVGGQTTRTTTVVNPITEQIAALRECLGGKPVTRIDVFEPTYQFAKANDGGGFAVTLGGRQVELLVLPTPAAATTAAEDATNQLIALQQTDPTRYATVAATATQTFGNVLEIVPAPLSERASAKVTACAQQSAVAALD